MNLDWTLNWGGGGCDTVVKDNYKGHFGEKKPHFWRQVGNFEAGIYTYGMKLLLVFIKVLYCSCICHCRKISLFLEDSELRPEGQCILFLNSSNMYI